MRLPNAEVHPMLAARAGGGPDRQVGLSLTPITVAPGGLSGITEPDAASYARVSLPASAWAAPSGRAVEATAPVFFPDPAEDWGVVVAYFLTDAAGVPQIPFAVGGSGGVKVSAGSSAVNVHPRITAPL